jgi:hypothetical protein
MQRFHLKGQGWRKTPGVDGPLDGREGGSRRGPTGPCEPGRKPRLSLSALICRIGRLLGASLLVALGAAEVQAVPVMQVTRGSVQGAIRPQAVMAGQDEGSRHFHYPVPALDGVVTVRSPSSA